MLDPFRLLDISDDFFLRRDGNILWVLPGPELLGDCSINGSLYAWNNYARRPISSELPCIFYVDTLTLSSS